MRDSKTVIAAIIFITLASIGVGKKALANNGDSRQCSNTDIQFSEDESGAMVLGCSGAIKGNDVVNQANWLAEQTLWDSAGQLSSTAELQTDEQWEFLAKYSPTSEVVDGRNDAFSLGTQNCYDNDNTSISCNSNATSLDLILNFGTTDTNSFLYDQFVLVAKAGNYYSLYQVEVMQAVESLTGTLSMVSKNGLSHLSVWARAGSPTSPPPVNVDSPTTFWLMAFGVVVVMRTSWRRGSGVKG